MPDFGRLATYRSRRDSSITPEPAADAPSKHDDGPIFVVQEHHASSLHWDLRLQHDGVLVSWAVPKGLPPAPGVERLAVHTEDHPLAYAEFEGEIPAGEYGGGWVRIADRGPVEIASWSENKVEFTLQGALLSGRHVLHQGRGGDPAHWNLRRRDPPTDPDYQPVPTGVSPMLAVSGEPPTTSEWTYEVKWDGYRALAHVVGGRVRLSSRSGQDLTASVNGLAGLGEVLAGHEVLLDGELVALGPDGRPDFGLLQQRMGTPARSRARVQAGRQATVTYLIFDLLHLDGHSTMGLAHRERRELLESLSLAGPVWSVPALLSGTVQEILAAVREQGLEGVMAKRSTSSYQSGRRSKQWRKLVNLRKQDVVIGGWQPGEGRRTGGIGALLLGVRMDDGTLRYVGNVGTGFTERALRELQTMLEPLRRDGSPFAAELPAARTRTARWVVPELVGEVEFATWTGDGMLRQPRWRGLKDG
ncbi:MAG: non-homologous end-joining DNA ligase, partial [Mycobacteriaceae bacterium]